SGLAHEPDGLSGGHVEVDAVQHLAWLRAESLAGEADAQVFDLEQAHAAPPTRAGGSSRTVSSSRIEPRSIWVYSCCGLRKISWISACSTISPCFITATRSHT